MPQAAQAENAAVDGQDVPETVQPLTQDQVRAQRDFMRSMPRFDLGDRWDLHMERYSVLSGLYQGLSPSFTKLALYSSLQNNAFKLVSPEFNPQGLPYANMRFQDYADVLSEIFEPAAEREAAKIEFEQRAQVRGEHPILYYRDKVNLFLKGYPKTNRDYGYFYNRVIANLLNSQMRDYLRLNIPDKLEDTHVFRAAIIKIANIVRRKYLDGEITEEMAVGAECFSTNNSYMENEPSGRAEAIFAVRQDKSKIGPCYHCQQYGHLKAQCARKANGLPPATVHNVEQECPAQTQNTVEALYANRYVGNSGNRYMGNSSRQARPVKPFTRPKVNTHKQERPVNRSNNNKRFTKRKIMVVYEQPDGQLFCEPIDGPEQVEDDQVGQQAADQDVHEIADKVETVRLEPQDAEVGSDYLPATFLGIGM